MQFQQLATRILVHTVIIALATACAIPLWAQTAAFTYQGRLIDAGSPANGTYDFRFTLWDSAAGGTQQPQSGPLTLTRSGVVVTDGAFTVSLDFTVLAFPSLAERYLEVAVKKPLEQLFTVLTPRQPVTSAPYAVRSLVATNAEQLNGLAANQYVLTTDPRLSDSRPPTAGSSNYIQNNAGTAQNANFNITGDGTVGKLGVGVTPSYGLDVNTELVAYHDIAFADGAHRWRLRSTANGLEAFQVYSHNNSLVNQTRVIVSDSGDMGVGTAAPAARLHAEATGGDAIYAHNVTGYAIHARSEQKA